METIQYGIDSMTGIVWSRVGSSIAIPVRYFKSMTPENNFKTSYQLEKFDISELCGTLGYITCTKKIDIVIKNIHRQFWGFKQLKV